MCRCRLTNLTCAARTCCAGVFRSVAGIGKSPAAADPLRPISAALAGLQLQPQQQQVQVQTPAAAPVQRPMSVLQSPGRVFAAVSSSAAQNAECLQILLGLCTQLDRYACPILVRMAMVVLCFRPMILGQHKPSTHQARLHCNGALDCFQYDMKAFLPEAHCFAKVAASVGCLYCTVDENAANFLHSLCGCLGLQGQHGRSAASAAGVLAAVTLQASAGGSGCGNHAGPAAATYIRCVALCRLCACVRNGQCLQVRYCEQVAVSYANTTSMCALQVCLAAMCTTSTSCRTWSSW